MGCVYFMVVYIGLFLFHAVDYVRSMYRINMKGISQFHMHGRLGVYYQILYLILILNIPTRTS